MKIKDMDDNQICDTLNAMLNEMEDRLITKLVIMNNSGINDSDFYFLNDMLKLTRAYMNLVPEVKKLNVEEQSGS